MYIKSGLEKKMTETICAVATPKGKGGITIIRISGDELVKYVQPLFPKLILTKLNANTITPTTTHTTARIIPNCLLSIRHHIKDKNKNIFKL